MAHGLGWYELALISAVFSALAAVGEKKVLFRENPVVFCLMLFAASTLMTAPFLRFVDPGALNPIGLAVLCGKSVLNAIAFLCVMQGLKRLELSNALPFLVLVPGLVALAAFLLIGDTLTVRQGSGLGLLLVGTWLVEAGRMGLRPPPPWRSRGHRYILAALALFTATSVLDKVIVVRLEIQPLPFVCFGNIFSLAFFAVAYGLSSQRPAGLRGCLRSSGGWIIGIALCTVVYRYTQISAVQLGPSVALVLAVKRLSVLLATLLGGRLFAESSLSRRALAVVVLLSGAFLVGT
ncbi:EamA family transporter [bacterium]|nr:EamA family transporter [bacterium]